MLQQFLDKHGLPYPGLIVADRELALFNILDEGLWGTAPYLLCKWHVNMNVMMKTCKLFLATIRTTDQVDKHPKSKEFLLNTTSS